MIINVKILNILGELQDCKYGSKYIDGLDEGGIDYIMYYILSSDTVGRLAIMPACRILSYVYSLVYSCLFLFSVPFFSSYTCWIVPIV